TVAEVVRDHQVVAAFGQDHAGVAADVAGAAGDQDAHASVSAGSGHRLSMTSPGWAPRTDRGRPRLAGRTTKRRILHAPRPPRAACRAIDVWRKERDTVAALRAIRVPPSDFPCA